jgi:hypothetical protein
MRVQNVKSGMLDGRPRFFSYMISIKDIAFFIIEKNKQIFYRHFFINLEKSYK